MEKKIKELMFFMRVRTRLETESFFPKAVVGTLQYKLKLRRCGKSWDVIVCKDRISRKRIVLIAWLPVHFLPKNEGKKKMS